MSKSAIYTVNSSTQAIAINENIQPATVVRKFGNNIVLAGDAIRVCGQGYYKVNANFTLSPTAIGTVTVTAYKDGVAVQGATASENVATANTPVNLALNFLIRENCPCCDSSSNLTFVLTGTPANNVDTSIVVEKIQ